MRLCSDDQEFGRQHPNIVRSLKLSLRMRIFLKIVFVLLYHLQNTYNI